MTVARKLTREVKNSMTFARKLNVHQYIGDIYAHLMGIDMCKTL